MIFASAFVAIGDGMSGLAGNTGEKVEAIKKLGQFNGPPPAGGGHIPSRLIPRKEPLSAPQLKVGQYKG